MTHEPSAPGNGDDSGRQRLFAKICTSLARLETRLDAIAFALTEHKADFKQLEGRFHVHLEQQPRYHELVARLEAELKALEQENEARREHHRDVQREKRQDRRALLTAAIGWFAAVITALAWITYEIVDHLID